MVSSRRIHKARKIPMPVQIPCPSLDTSVLNSMYVLTAVTGEIDVELWTSHGYEWFA